MRTEKALRVKACFQLGQGAADGVGLVSHVDRHLLVCDADPVNAFGIQYPDAVPIAHGQAGQVASLGRQAL